MKRTKKPLGLSDQMKVKASRPAEKKADLHGDISIMRSTGSTLLDLAISGGRIRKGGIPAGIFVEIFGPSGSGKTVLLSEIAGDIQRKEGEVMFHDPEARLNKQFAKMFDLNIDEMSYQTPDTVTEVFSKARSWKPKVGKTHGIFADSLAALSTDLEMGKDEGDKMGGRRAKEFSEQLRKTCREIKKKKYLMVCSNQLRQNMGGGEFEPKYKSPGGEALAFYASLRLRTFQPSKIWKTKTVAKKEVKRCIGVTIKIEVFKNSVWKPYRTAPLTILFDYGVDDIRQNLQFIKDYTDNTTYTVGGKKLNAALEKSIQIVERDNREVELQEEVIDLWESIESKFDSNRKNKKR